MICWSPLKIQLQSPDVSEGVIKKFVRICIEQLLSVIDKAASRNILERANSNRLDVTANSLQRVDEDLNDLDVSGAIDEPAKIVSVSSVLHEELNEILMMSSLSLCIRI